MFQQRVTQDIALGIEAYEHLQIATETTRGALNGCSEVVALGILCLINHIGHFLALGIVLLNGVGLGHLEVGHTHHGLDTIGQGLGFLSSDRSFGEVVHISEDTTHDNGY